jgi:lipooligosaccharide transport system ATP-binding protein
MLPIIEAESLTKKFNGLTAVDGISFSVQPGECFGILGPNGAGKTTTIRMLYGFSPMTGGSLRVFGLDLPERLREVKYHIGVCQQENSIDPDLTVEQNLEIFARYFDIPRSERRQRTRELLKFITLENRHDSAVTELSGGMMRRLVLARALINKPDLVILDEPTTGLDPQSRRSFWERLESLRAGGLTILLTTHYMEEASHLCDRIIITDHGRIIAQGSPAELIREHVGEQVLEITEPAAELGAYLVQAGLDHERFANRVIIYRGDRGALQRIAADFCRSGGCSLRRATLEDVFLKITGRELQE